jgi:hypothetical protein
VEKRALTQMLAGLSRKGIVTAAPDKVSYLKDYLDCRTAAKGGRVLRCEDCATHAVVYNACNRRGCPICSRKNQLNWQVKMRQRLLPTSHHHLVFSFPESFTDKWLQRPRATVHELIKGVRKVIGKLERQRQITLGTILVFQSHCQGLAYKAHVHCLITDGGLDQQDQWQPLGVLPLGEMTTWLEKALAGEEPDKGWRIHESRHQAGGDAVVQYLGQRLHGAVVTAEEVLECDDRVAINGRNGSIELASSVFALRYLNHIPQKGTVLVRNCGLYSNRQKTRHEVARVLLGGGEIPVQGEWEERCPRCKGLLKTILNYLTKPLEFDHEQYGFGVDPPVHWELSRAS